MKTKGFPILGAPATSTTAPTASVQLEIPSCVQLRGPKLGGGKVGILSNFPPSQSKTVLTSPPLTQLRKSFSPPRGPQILGWCGGGGYWQPLAFVCLRATTCAGLAAANRRQPTHPHRLGARAHSRQRETAERPGEVGLGPSLSSSFAISLSLPFVHLLEGAAPTLCQPFLGGGTPTVLPSDLCLQVLKL